MITKQKLFWPVSLGTALIFQGLFYDFSAGLNYLVFTLLFLAILRFYVKPETYSAPFKFILFLFIAITASVIFAHTTYSLFIYWIFTIVLISTACYSQIKHIEITPLLMISGLEVLISSVNKNRQTGLLRKLTPFLKFIILPIFTIVILLWLYSFSNPLFYESISNILEYISKILDKISFPRFFFTLLGFVITVVFISNYPSNAIVTNDNSISHLLIRIKNKAVKIAGLSKLLLRKKQVAVVTFLILNVMIAWLNYLDIVNIWIDFKWDGGLLKDMVHEGTNVLIFAILISIGISLFYLNSNLVFLKNNRFFYGLLILWLLQNIIMAISVSIRNTIYIEHFALAYKRIFVYFFLLACVVGLLSITYKIIFKRSISFLVSINSFSVLAILLSSSFFDWDKIIAKHNFENYKNSFVHFKFLSTLNNSALPYLIKTDEELVEIFETQSDKYVFVREKEFEKIDYQTLIENRKTKFISQWKRKSLLEWNYPEYVAFKKLSE